MVTTLRHLHQRCRLTVDQLLYALRNATDSGLTGSANIELLALEHRILMSASPAAVAPVAEVVDAAEACADTATGICDAVATDATAGDHIYSWAGSDGQSTQGATERVDQTRTVELVVIDPAAQDYQQLVDDLMSQTDRAFEILILDPRLDGIGQITDALAELSDVSAIHLVSHGEDGEILLGTSVLSERTIGRYAAELVAWQHSLSADADLLIYGCDLAASQDGIALTHSLNTMLGADIAASDDDTGHAQFGADWDLEFTLGTVEASVAFTEQLQQQWAGKLAVITVDTTDDEVTSNGLTSLREAIIQANTGGGGDTIVLGAGTYTLSLTGIGEDAAATGDLDILKSLTITGAGADQTIIDGDGIDRIFHILNSSTVVNLSGVTIQDGAAEHNAAGIFIDDESTLNLTDAVLQNNIGNATPGGGAGGAVHVHGTFNADRVLFANNTAESGGAIYFHNAVDGTLTNVTISGNTAAASGGGIYSDSTSITIVNSTIAFNTADTGGGIRMQSGGAVGDLKNTIVAKNTGTSANPDLQGNYSSSGNNLIGDGTGQSDLNNGVNGDQVGTGGAPIDPLLGALAENGGPMRTHALQAGSAAIDAGTSSGAPAVDQRGTARDASPDVGAYEYSTAPDATIAYEPFDYAAGSLDGQNGGTGWATAWNLESGSSAQVNPTGLTTPPGLPAGQGGTLEMNTTITFEQSRDLSTTLGADGTTAWFSFLLKPDGTGFGGISLEIGDGTGAENTVNVGTNGNDFLVGIDGTATGVQIDNVVANAQTYFLVVQVDFAAGNDTVTLYVNPTAGVSSPDSPAPMTAQLTTADLGTFTRVGVIGGFLGNNSNIDEIRVGGTFAAVAGGAINQPPTADAGGPYTINEGADLSLDASASNDPESDPLTYKWDLDNDGDFGEAGAPTGVNPVVTWSTLQSFGISDNGSFTIGLQVDDGNGGTDTATVTLAVNNVAPTITSSSTATTPENTTAVQTVAASDPVDSVTFSITGGADETLFSIHTTSGVLTFDAPPDFESPGDVGRNNVYEVEVTASDGDGGFDVQTISITVTAANDNVPVVDPSQSFSVSEAAGNGVSLGTLTASDDDSGTVFSNWTITGGNTDGIFALNSSTGELTVLNNTNLDFETTTAYTLSVTVSDGMNTSLIETIAVAVTNTNEAPSAANDSYGVLEGGSISVPAISGVVSNDSDPEGHTLTASLLSGPAFAAAFSLNPDGSFSYTHDGSETTSDSFTYQVSDGFGGSDSATVTLTISPQNESPSTSGLSDINTSEDSAIPAFSVAAAFTDSDPGDVLRYSVSQPGGANPLLQSLSINQNSGVLTVALSANASGTAAVRVTATDTGGLSVSTDFQVNVSPVNDRPTVISHSFMADSNGMISVSAPGLLAGAADAEGQPLTIVLMSTTTHGSVILNANGSFTYAADAGFPGFDAFTFAATDGVLTSTAATVTITAPGQVGGAPPATDPDIATESASGDETESGEESDAATVTDAVSGSSPSVASPVSNDGAGGSPASRRRSTEEEVAAAFLRNTEGTVVEIWSATGAEITTVEGDRVDASAAAASGSSGGRHGDVRESADENENDSAATAGALQPWMQPLAQQRMWRQLDALENDAAAGLNFENTVVGSVGVVTTGFAVGSVLWAVRGGVLLSGLLAQLPIWTLFDPLLVIDGVVKEEESGESIRDIVDQQGSENDQAERSSPTEQTDPAHVPVTQLNNDN